MSLSRKLIEKLVANEIESNKEKYKDLSKEKLFELANQVFLQQITHDDDKIIRKNLQDKVEHFSSLMIEEGGE